MDNTKTYVFEKLTPIDDSDISVYKSALDFVFENDDVRNVSISGAYGAGKSSVLSSYKREKPELKFLHISLAHFQSEEVNSNSDESVKEVILEGKILNQLIHQIPADKIPQTNFRVKKTTNNRKVFLCTVAIVFFVLSLFHIFLFNSWAQFVDLLPAGKVQTILTLSTSTSSLLISGVVSFIILCIFLYCIIRTQKNKNIFKKLSIQGNEIEIFEESEDSYFDKYLNEVLYLFENVDANVIVFEDMDRFNANQIFERLREINTLANLQRSKENRPILRFFYLLRDDIFVSKDRTKFFDCIIPIVPVVDSSNSYDQFIYHLKKNNLLEEFDESFLQGISLYVNDMRLLKNICNEFLIYYNRLNTTELNYNKMLALITYKNLFPRDFNNLQLNKGFVFSLFDNKTEFVKDEIVSVQSKLDATLNLVKSIENEVAKSKSELDTIFNAKRNYYSNLLSNADQLIYNKRLEYITDRGNGRVQELEEEINIFSDRIQSLSNASLAQIITRDNIDQIFNLATENEIGVKDNYSEIKGSEYFDLLKYLIRNGYIDETYADYMTYFYENSLGRVDKTFLRSVTDRKAKPYAYELKDPSMILRRLRPTDFDQEETLNFMLFDYLLEQRDEKYFDHLQHLILQLHNTKNYSFIAQYFDRTVHPGCFVRVFNEQWPSLFTDMQNDSSFDNKQLKRYSVLSIYYSDDDTLKTMDSNAAFSNFIMLSKDYLDITDPQINKLISVFRLLGVSFPAIDYECSNKDLFWSIYENDLYILNFDNLQLILEKIFVVDSIEDIRHKSYTKILEDSDSPLYKRINTNFSDYCDILLGECGGKISDSEDAAISLLNRVDIDSLQKQRYIQCLSTPISVLRKLEDQTVWGTLVSSGLLFCSEENIMDYFCFKGEIDDPLVDFINMSSEQLDFSKKHTGFTDEQLKDLFDHTIICNKINDIQYEQIITTVGFYYPTFDFSGINDSKMRILIDNDVAVMNEETLKYLRKEYPSVLSYFIQMHIDAYVELMTDELFVHSELVEILGWDVPDYLKLKLLGFSEKPISVIGKNYSDEVCVYILTHNLLQTDMESLYLSYGNQSDEIKAIIEGNAEKYIEQVIASPCIAAPALREYLLKSKNMEVADKMHLIAAMIPSIGQDYACKCLLMVGLDEYIKIFDSHSRPKFAINEQNDRLLSAFQQKNWIFEYLEDNTRPGFYKIHRREQKKSMLRIK